MVILTSVTCQKGESLGLNCTFFDLTDTLEFAEPLNSILSQWQPRPTSEDLLGHQRNLLLFIDTVNTLCPNHSFRLQCYGCIYTEPPQSEIVVMDGNHQTMTLDIYTPNNHTMHFAGWHP